MTNEPSNSSSGGLTFCSIITKNYLAHARTLSESIRAYHPSARQFVLVLDPAEGHFDLECEPFTVVTMEELGLSSTQRYRFQYTPFELSCAAKPWLMRHLLRHYDVRKLVYFDSDIMVTHNLRPLSRLLNTHSVIITPHLTNPYEDDKHPGEVSMLQSGAYNMGFVAVSKCPAAEEFLAWWDRRLDRGCLNAVERGLFVDQKWADLVPGLFDNVLLLREPGYNVAYWNMHGRSVTTKGGTPYIGRSPCYFFHFSGYDPNDLENISKHQNRLHFDQLGEARSIYQHYAKRLRANNLEECQQWPYTWSRFDTGTPIADCIRRLYHGLGEGCEQFGDPFETAGPHSYHSWLTTAGVSGLAPLFQSIYDVRADLRAAFPDIAGADRAGFLDWAKNHAEPEHGIPVGLVHAACGTTDVPSVYEGSQWGFADGIPGPVTESFGANVLGFLQSEKGMGEAVRSTARCMAVTGTPHTLNNWVDGLSSNRDDTLLASAFDLTNPYPVNIVQLNADISNYLAAKMPWYFKGRYNIGYWNWELEWFPPEWQSSFDLYDEIWAPSRFSRDCFARVSPIPVHYVPYAISVPPPMRQEPTRERFGLPQNTFMFLFAFDFHSFYERKNPSAAVEAFRRAFGNRRDVTLVLKPSRPHADPTHYSELLMACGRAPNIRILTDILPRQEMYSLLRLCDGYVSLHRSEGFGLPIAEAMALGKPVVATNYSANVDFMNESNSFPVDYSVTEITDDHGPYRRGAKWADADVAHAAEQMRRVVDEPLRTARLAARAEEDIERLLSPAAVGRTIHERLAAILPGVHSGSTGQTLQRVA